MLFWRQYFFLLSNTTTKKVFSFFWYWCFYLHWLRVSVSPLWGIFTKSAVWADSVYYPRCLSVYLCHCLKPTSGGQTNFWLKVLAFILASDDTIFQNIPLFQKKNISNVLSLKVAINLSKSRPNSSKKNSAKFLYLQSFPLKRMDINDFVEIVILGYDHWPQFFLSKCL